MRMRAVPAFLQEAGADARLWLRRNPAPGVAVISTALLMGAGGAFAVAERQPFGDDVQVRQVLEVVQPATALEQQEATLQKHRFTLYRHTETREDDTAGSLLKRLGVVDGAAEAYLRKNDQVRAEVLSLKKRYVQAEMATDGTLQSLQVVWLDPEQPRRYKTLEMKRGETGFVHDIRSGDVDVTAEMAHAQVEGSYFRATGAAGVPVEVANQVLDIFEPVANVKDQIRKNDQITVVYERLAVNGQVLGSGRVLSVDMQVQGQPHRAVWFGNKNGGQYYTPEGSSLSLAYVHPLPGAVMTSGFEPYRVHPVFGDVRAHTGVDFSAPTGTPVHSAGDGVVSFAGQQNGYGNIIVIQHGSGQSTAYGHLSQIGVTVGEHVRQNAIIGKVGSTGWSTGPHLHFETRDNDVPQNPLIALEEKRAGTIAANQRGAFGKVLADAQRNWAQAQTLQLASAN